MRTIEDFQATDENELLNDILDMPDEDLKTGIKAAILNSAKIAYHAELVRRATERDARATRWLARIAVGIALLALALQLLPLTR